MGWEARLQPHHRHGGQRDRVHARTERWGTWPAVLPLLCPWGNPRTAPADKGVDRQVQGQVRYGLERTPTTNLRQPETVGGDSRECATHTVARRHSEELECALPRREEALHTASGGIRRLRGLYRPRDRPSHPG